MIANPYPGLRPFRQDESHLFFGRDGQADAILERLKERHFVAIVGVSGCGKSSLLNAGVFPGLHGGLLATKQREWRVARLQPRDKPLEQLSRALISAKAVVDLGPETPGLATSMLQHSSAGLVNLVKGRLASESAANEPIATGASPGAASSEGGGGAFALLIVVDQFEELFRFAANTSPEEASHFVQLLIEAVRAGASGLPLYVAIAMRSDFEGECAVFPGLPELINQAQYLVPRMSLRQREAAIVRPAATEHREIARSLLDRLLDDMGENPDQLPVLQHALQRTWETWFRRTGGQGEVALEDYHSPEVGGITGAIENHAEEAFRSLPEAQQSLAGALFRCITERAEDRRPVRRPLQLGTIARIAGVSSAELIPVIDAFRTRGRTFLTPPEEVPLTESTLIDISHESLIRNWPRLATWAKQESTAAGELRRLRESSRAFLEKTQDPMDRLELTRVERWRRGNFADDPKAKPEIVPSEDWARLYFGSDAPEDFRRTEAYIDESQKHLRVNDRRDQVRYGLLGLLVILCVLGAIYLGVQRIRSANREAEEAKKRLNVITAFAKTADELPPILLSNAKSALAEAEQQTEKIIKVLGAAGVDPPPDPATIKDLEKTRTVAERAVDAMEKLATSMKEVADILNDERLRGQAKELNLDATGLRLRQYALMKNPEARKAIEVAFEKRVIDAEQELTGLNPDQLDPELVKAKREKEIPAATAMVSAVDGIIGTAISLGFEPSDFKKFESRFNSLGRTLAAIQKLSLGAAATLTTWKPDAAVALTHAAKVNRVRFLTDPKLGPLIVSAGEDRNVSLWNPGGKQLASMPTSSAINDLSFNPKANAIAVASNGSTVRIIRWTDLSNASTIKFEAFERHSDSVTDVEFSHGGQRVASGSADRTVRVFESQTLRQLYSTSPPLPGIVTSVAFHPRDNMVVSGCDDGGVRLHSIDEPGAPLLGNRMGAPARRPEFSADGNLVIAGSGDKTVRIWTINPRKEIANFPHAAPVTQATFRPIQNPLGDVFVSCATNGEVRWVTGTWTETVSKTLTDTILEPRHPGAVRSATWSLDGRWLATVGGGEVLVWDLASGSPVARVRLGGLPKETSRAEFSDNAALLVTYGGDNTVYLWDLTKIPQS